MQSINWKINITEVSQYLYLISAPTRTTSSRKPFSMIKDRLQELKLVAQLPQKYSENEEVHIEIHNANDGGDEITQFLNKVEKIRIAIDELKTNNHEILRLYNIILSLPRGKEQNYSEVEDRKEAVSHNISQIRKQLKVLEAEMPKNEEDKSALSRIKHIQLSTVAWMFAEAVQAYNEILIKYHERCKAIMQRQLRIFDKTATEEELESMIEKNETALFTQNIVADTLEAQLALSQIKERQGELMKMESSIREVRDAFVHLATIIETQGDNISRIEHHVLKASDYTDRGYKQLTKARKKREKAIKRKQFLLILLVIIVCIVFILLVI